MRLPNLIIFVNKELTEQVQSVIEQQLFITVTLTHLQYNTLDINIIDGYSRTDRVLVLIDYQDTPLVNDGYADTVLYFSNGLLSVQKNKYGPPGLTWAAATITLDQLVYKDLYQAKSSKPTISPTFTTQKSIDPFGGEIIIHHYKDNR